MFLEFRVGFQTLLNPKKAPEENMLVPKGVSGSAWLIKCFGFEGQVALEGLSMKGFRAAWWALGWRPCFND